MSDSVKGSMIQDTSTDHLLTVSASPHIRSHATTTSLMLDVIIALIPATIASVALFGPRALLITAISVISCMLFEFISRKVMKRSGTLGDLSAIVTGILLAFNLPSTLPLWMVPIGSFVAIVVVKQFFGGIGQNFVNPALIGRIVLMVSFPTAMSTWVKNYDWSGADAVTSATPLASLSSIFDGADYSAAAFQGMPSTLEMLFGKTGGCIGETCAIAIILGLIYLVARRVVTPTIPLVYIGTVAVLMFIASKGSVQFTVAQVLSGGLLLGAVFMATDYTTSPINEKGKLIYAIGCGLLTVAIRLYGSLPEGVSFSIIIMNILAPLIDLATKNKPFGYIKAKKHKKKEADAE